MAEVVYDDIWRPHRMGSFETILKLPSSRGEGLRRIYNLDGIIVIVEEYRLKEKLFYHGSGMPTSVGLSFCLSGKIEWSLDGMDNSRHTRAGQWELLQAATSHGRACYDHRDPIKVVNICLPPVHTRHLLPPGSLWLTAGGDADAEMRRSGYHYQSGAASPAMHNALHQLLCCDFQGDARRLYLQGKIMELLALQLSALQNPPAAKFKPLKPGDRRRIRRARDILLEDIANPPAVKKLARRVGINQTKLKQGFHQLFATTPYQCLLAKRMQTARRWLASGNVNVTETAHAVGYANRAHFARAFRRHYGFPPSKLIAQQPKKTDRVP